jgi:hypothetical protein
MSARLLHLYNVIHCIYFDATYMFLLHYVNFGSPARAVARAGTPVRRDFTFCTLVSLQLSAAQ